MNEFLNTTRERLLTQDYATLNIVIGNESCDLDSAVSAVVYASFLAWQHEQMKCSVCTKSKRAEDAKDDLFLPVLNVTREDYEIKTEVVFCLRQKGIGAENLVFKDDITLPEMLSSSEANVILVDHHVLASSDKILAPYVTEIIDHRPIDKSQWDYRPDTRSTIEIVGSCATLVAQRINDLSALFAKKADFFDEYPVCCDLLHSTIILDTVNFCKEVNKATPRDEEIIEYLESKLKPSDNERVRKQKLEDLVGARRDTSTLTAAQLVNKDVKVVADILVPSFPLLVKDFLLRPEALHAVAEALKRRGCSAALLLGMDLSAGLQRDAAVFCPTADARTDELCTYLEAWKPSLELIEEKLPEHLDSKRLRYFIQNNLSASRKQYMPVLNEFISSK